MIKRLLIILFPSLILTITLIAGTTGKLAGYVKDAATGDALIGVNVILEGTNYGAATDVNGFYVINNLPPGAYKVNFSAIGYQKKQFVNVKVSVDFTTSLDVELNTATIELETIVVEAQAPLVRKDLTSSQVTIDANHIQTLPVESISQILTLQAGVTQGVGGELHIRGGRSNEILYTVNGVSISNPFNNSATIQIATNAIQELSVVSGTFNAEYGNALSGVVNTVTKEGGNQYTGRVSAYTGDHISSRSNTFFNVDDANPFSNHVYEMTFGGPFPYSNNQFSFFLSGRYEYDEGWLYGVREQNIYDSVYINPADPNDVRVTSTGERAIVPMSWSRDFSGTAKLTYKPIPTIKVNFDALYSRSKSQGYSHSFKYNPDANTTAYDEGILTTLELRHTLNSKTFYTLKGSYNFHDYKNYLFPLLESEGKAVDYYPGLGTENYYADPRYQPDHKLTRPSPYTFYFGGTQNSHNYERAQTWLAKFDITSQISANHEIKFGLQGRLNQLDYENFVIRRDSTRNLTPTIPGIETADHDLYTRKPVEFSTYLQDKMEFDKMILNIGIRYDYFHPKAQYSTNIFYPSPKDPLLPDYVDPSTLLADAPAKHQISPRVGVSFPITDRGIIHFSYGHFFQMPPFQYLYSNADFKYSLAVGRQLFGNAHLNPEKQVTYELGLQQQLTDDIAFNVTGFYKDVRDLLALQVIRVSGDRTYLKYVNKDYGNIKGITFSLTKRKNKGDILGVTLDYTFQVMEGNDTNADAFFLDLSSGRQTENIPVYLSWDQTHNLNTTVSVGEAGDWNVTLVGRIGTGLPYTPQILEKQIWVQTNSGRRPSTMRVDLLAEKNLSLFGVDFIIFLKVFNLFDTLNERFVYDDTGRASYSLFQSTGGAKSADDLAAKVPGVHSSEEYYQRPNYYYPPREVRLGLSYEF
jgi:outer membrane receptor protein involved in Fe transport